MSTQGTLIPVAPVYRYAFEPSVLMTEVHDTLRLAIVAVESMHGRFRVLRDVEVECDFRKRQVVISGMTDAGQSLNDIFAGYASREFGEGAFTVTREAPGPPGHPGPPADLTS